MTYSSEIKPSLPAELIALSEEFSIWQVVFESDEQEFSLRGIAS